MGKNPQKLIFCFWFNQKQAKPEAKPGLLKAEARPVGEPGNHGGPGGFGPAWVLAIGEWMEI